MKKISRRAAVAIDGLEGLADSVHPRIQALYAARGITQPHQLSRSLKDIHSPNTLKGLEVAVVLLKHAVVAQKRILIVGDFDADGATSCALCVLVLKAMGVEWVNYLVPNRFEFGYGLTPEIVEVAKLQQPDLIITVDNGIASIDGVRCAKAAGISVVITDHHLPGDELPQADAIVNPNQRGCDFPSKNLAGVVVIFYVMAALRSALREDDWFTTMSIAEPNMADYLDLVALGTVADVVPLDHNNRILVYQGLQRIRSGKGRPGIKALIEIAGKSEQRLVASDFGFGLGPRLNAAGRLDDMSFGIECLMCPSESIAREMAIELDSLNKDRRAIETGMKNEAMALLEQLEVDNGTEISWGLCLYDAQWHQGVIGILASRIKEKYNRPVIVFANASDTEIKGSARSIAGFHIRDALDAVANANPGLLSKFGGHAMAAGLSLPKQNFVAFQQAFDTEVRRLLVASDLQAEVMSDGELSASEQNLAMAQLLREAGPWGQHFPEPIFDGLFNVVQQRLVGGSHLKLVLMKPDDGQVIDAIAFNIDVDVWPDNAIKQVRAAYKLDVNEFRGQQSAQLLVEHLEAVS
jgi:single-stranded-DNA-specific exonuclease